MRIGIENQPRTPARGSAVMRINLPPGFRFTDKPPYPISGLFAVAGLLRSEKLSQRLRFQKARLQQSRAEQRQVLRRGQKSSARPLIAVVNIRSISQFAPVRFAVGACTLLDDFRGLIGYGVPQTERRKDMRVHVGKEILA